MLWWFKNKERTNSVDDLALIAKYKRTIYDLERQKEDLIHNNNELVHQLTGRIKQLVKEKEELTAQLKSKEEAERAHMRIIRFYTER